MFYKSGTFDMPGSGASGMLHLVEAIFLILQVVELMVLVILVQVEVLVHSSLLRCLQDTVLLRQGCR